MKYSIVVPIYFDGYLAPALCDEIKKTMSAYLGTDAIHEEVELIFVNDGSTNESMNYLKQVYEEHPFVRIIDLSRNFGQHQAIACGMQHAQGEVVIRMNVDMQDHPRFIPRLLDELHATEGDLVVGQYDLRKSPWPDKLTSDMYFHFFRLLTGFNIPKNTSPLRAMSRRYVDAYNRLSERTRFPQGLDAWLGFNHRCVPIEHQERRDKKSSYTFLKRLSLAFNGILYFSDRPIQFVAGTGLVISLLGLLLAAVIVITKLLGMEYLPGYASLAAIGLIALGLQLFCTGLVGLYVAKTFVEVKNRPIYLVKQIYNRTIKQEYTHEQET
jgi:glycosyltransferase involved in cell wall biosynthesis